MNLDWLLSKGHAPSAEEGEWVLPLSSNKSAAWLKEKRQDYWKQSAGKTAARKFSLYVLLVYVIVFAILSSLGTIADLLGPVGRDLGALIIAWMPAIYALVMAWLFCALRSKFSHIKIKQDGLTFHNVGSASEFHGFNIPWNSPLIPWSAITYVKAATRSHAQPSIGFSNAFAMKRPLPELQSLSLSVRLSDVQNPRSILAQEGLFVFFSKRFRNASSAETEFQFIPQAMTDKDFKQLMNALHANLPPEAIDPSADQIVPQQSWQDYTTIWLQELNESTSRIAALPPGTILKGPQDHYEIVERLGSGGQALTYRALRKGATENDQQEVVVLKEFVLPASGGSEIVQKTMTNITKEAELLQSLDHPQIVRCFGWFMSGRRAYLALSLIHGKTLRDVVQQHGPLSQDTVIGYAEQMCDLLHYLHSKEPPVVHRDFTPDNLMVDDDGKLFLMDFDVARRLESQTATRTVVGKHNYMPPEQFRGNATTQSDLYALGATLHWLLTGTDPEPITVCHPKQIREEVTVGLDDLIARATAQDCGKRFSSADEIHQALNGLSIIQIKEAVESVTNRRID